MQTTEERTFKVGDSVTWTHTVMNGNSINFRTRSGKVLLVHNTYCIIRKRNGQNEAVRKERMRLATERTELTSVVGGISMILPQPKA